MLIGRDSEIERVQTLIDGARHSSSSVLVITGQAGIGKTSLLKSAGDLASGFTVLTTTGIQDESDISYAHLADLLHPLYDQIPRIPSRQAAALSSVLAIGPVETADRLVVAAATLSLITGAAAVAPVLMMVDDCQWIDSASREALMFVARRLHADNVAVLFAARDEHDEPRLDKFPHLRLDALDPRSCRALVRATIGPLPTHTMSRLVESAGGNPLALTDLPTVQSLEQIEAWTHSGTPLPIDRLLAHAFSSSIGQLPVSTRAALTALAIVGSDNATVLRRALSACDLTGSDLEPAEDADVVVARGGQLRFRHPLIRSAVYQQATPRQRRAIHLIAAEALAEEHAPPAVDRRAAHLIAAGITTDPAFASALHRTGEQALATQNFPSARLLLERSARLTPPGRERAQRLIKAAHAARLAGAINDARSLADQARADEGADDSTIVIDYLSCRLAIWAGDLRSGRDRLIRLTESSLPIPPELRAYMLADIALASVEVGDLAGADRASAEALHQSDPSRPTADLQIVAVRMIVRSLLGDDTELPELINRAAEVDALDPVTFDITEQLLLIVGLAHLFTENVEPSHHVLTTAVDGARQRGAIGALPFRVGRLAWTQHWRGDWAQATASAHEALALAADTGWNGERTNALIVLSRIESLTGRHADSHHHATEALALAETTGSRSYQAMADSVLGSLAFTMGHTEQALNRFARVRSFADAEGVVDNPMMWWTADCIECLVDGNHHDEAEALLRQAESKPANRSRPAAAAVLTRCRALLEPSLAEEHLRESLRLHDKTQMPFEQARSQLHLGRYLRRQRHPEAREALAAALSTFERLGSPDWAAKTRNELRAAGVRLAEPAAGLEALTPQELAVALAVSRGMTNREVAAHLFLSVKTIEYHLSHVYAKLGINNRARLVALVARAG